MYLFIVFVGIFFQCSLAEKVPICTTVQYSGFFTDCATHSNITSYSFQVKAAKYQNTTFPNYLNFQFSHLNDSLVDYSTFKFVLVKRVAFSCDSIINCFMYFPNGRATYSFTFQNYQIDSTIEIFYNDGTIFDGARGLFFNYFTNSCINQQSLSCDSSPFLHTETVCCIDYDFIVIPDSSEDTCVNFQSNVEINTNNGISHNFVMNYDITNNGGLTMTVTPLDNILTYDSYAFGPLNEYGPLYNNGYCSGKYLAPNSTCEVSLPNPTEDFQYEFLLASTFFAGNAFHRYNGVIVGELIRRHGMYFRDNNISFTPSNPCWKNIWHPYAISQSNDTIESSFCCIKFRIGSQTTAKPTTLNVTSSITPTLTPTSIPPTMDPRSNAIGASCSNDTTQAWLDIVFVIDTSNAMTRRDLNELSGQIATFMKKFTFGQIGNHTIRAAILGYATDVTTFYQLTDTTNYNDFEDKLFDFADQASMNDDGGNVQGALQQAYSLIQSQKGFRVPLIILIAAAYNPTGFQGAYHTANVIKSDGITIVVINFATTDGVLTDALENISSPGYYYISSQSQLYSQLPYALTQSLYYACKEKNKQKLLVNCVCPPNFLQFRLYNSASKTYTNYADCLYGFDGYTSPDNAERVCQPGTLVAITSQEKLDFITDKIIPYSLKGQKKFTIGLHKSTDLQWKWWGYNKTEYPLGDFPSMLDTPAIDDNYGYMWNFQGFNWKLQTGEDLPLPYICQSRSCDAEYICDQNAAKMEA